MGLATTYLPGSAVHQPEFTSMMRLELQCNVDGCPHMSGIVPDEKAVTQYHNNRDVNYMRTRIGGSIYDGQSVLITDRDFAGIRDCLLDIGNHGYFIIISPVRPNGCKKTTR